ncbi:Protein of unknown function [Gryllus bimaculatus]|nr:Protein of unknown function [Gryllus bimaculatus]
MVIIPSLLSRSTPRASAPSRDIGRRSSGEHKIRGGVSVAARSRSRSHLFRSAPLRTVTMKIALVLVVTCAVALTGVWAQKSPLCLLVGSLVDLISLLLVQQLLCTVTAEGGACPGLKATLVALRATLVNETVRSAQVGDLIGLAQRLSASNRRGPLQTPPEDVPPVSRGQGENRTSDIARPSPGQPGSRASGLMQVRTAKARPGPDRSTETTLRDGARFHGLFSARRLVEEDALPPHRDAQDLDRKKPRRRGLLRNWKEACLSVSSIVAGKFYGNTHGHKARLPTDLQQFCLGV